MSAEGAKVEPGFHRGVALLVAGTFFMENLDATIISTAAPAVSASLGVDSASVGVAVTAYLVSVAVLVPLSGWLSQRWGTRRLLLAAIVVFTLASALCAASSSLVELVSFRVLQGVGGAMMVPVGRLSVLRRAGKAELVRAVAILTWPALVAPVLAPLLGGLLATYSSWRWIFLINLPLGVIAFAVGLRLLEREPTHRPPPLDSVGLLLSGAGLGLLVWASSALAAPTPRWLVLVATGAGALVLLGLAIRHLRSTAHPLLDLTVLRVRTMRLAHLSGGVFRMTVSAVPFLLPLMFQEAFAWTAVRAGAVTLFVFVGNLVIKPATTGLLRRFGFRQTLVGATVVVAASMVGESLLTRGTPLWLLLVIITVGGAARSVGFTGYNTIAFADIEQSDMTAANTVSSTLQQLAAGFGVAVAAVAVQLGAHLRNGAAAQQGDGATGAYRFAFLLIAALTVVSVVDAWRLDVHAGRSIRPAPRAPMR
jgi:EmrB/QacA subfamily drug resistance transporter